MYNQWQHIGQRPQGMAQVPQYQMAQQQQYWQYYSQMQGQQTVAQGSAPLFQPPPPLGPPPPTDEPKPPLPGLDPAPPVEPPNDEKPPLPPEPPPTDTKGKINDVEQQKMTELQKQAADWQEQQRQWAEYQQNLSTYHQQLQQWQQTHGEQMATSSANQFPPTSQPPPATLPQSQSSSLSQPPPTNTVSSAILQPTATAIQETIEDVEREEKEFQNQYADWMKQYTDWKEQNKDHPNRDLYNQYEQQWKQYEGQMEEKRRVLNERKQRASQAQQIASQQSITFPIQGQTVNSQSQFGGPQQIRPGVPQGQNFTVPPPRHDGPPSRFGGPPSQRFDGPHGLQSEASGGGVSRFDAPGGSRFERPQGHRFEVPGSSSMQHPSGNRFEGPGGNRFAGPSGNRFEGPGGNRFEGPGGKRFEVPGGNRFEGPGGKRFEAPIRNRFEGPGEKKFERPSGNRFEGPGGNRFEGPGGNRFEGPGGNRFEGPGGNRFDGTGGQKFEGPSGNRFEGPGGNRFPGPGGNRFDSPGLKRLEVPSGNQFEGPGGYIPGPNGGPFRGARRGISETRRGGHFGPPPGMNRGGLTGSQFGKANFDEPEQAFEEGAGEETRYEEEGQMFNEQGQPLEESDKQFDEENVEEASQHDSMSEVNQEGEQLLGMDEENFDDVNQEEGFGVPPMHAGGMRSRFGHPSQHMRGDRGAPFDGPRGFDGPQRFNNPQQMKEMSGFPGQMRFRGPRPFRVHERFGDPGQFSMRGNRGRPPFVPQGRGRGQQQGGPISLMDVRFEKPQGRVEEGIESGEFEGTDQMVFEEEVQDFTQDIDAQFPPRGRGGWGRGRPMRGRGRGRGMDHFAPEEDFGQDEGWSQGQGGFGMRARGRGMRGRDGRGRGGWSGGHHDAPYHEEEVEAEGLEQDGTGPLNPQLQPPHLRQQANESQKENIDADAANQLFSDREHALIIKAAEELKALRDQLEQESKGSDDKPKEGDDSQPLVPYDDEEESREEGDFQRQARNMGRGGPGRFPPPEHHDPEDVLQMIDQRLGGGFPMRREIFRGGPQRSHGGFPRDFLDADDLGMGSGRGRGLPPRRGLPQRGRDELSHLALLGRSRDPLEVLLEQRLGRRPRSSLEDHLLRDLLPPVDPLSDPLLEERYRLERRRLLDPLLDPLRESGLGGDIMRDLRFQPRLPMERRFSPTPQAFTRTAPPPPLAQPPQVIDYGHGQGTSTTSEDSEKVKDTRAEKDLPAAYRDEMDSRHNERSRERSRSRERDVDYRERDGRDRYDRDRYRSDHRSRARSRDRDRYDRDRDRPREHRERRDDFDFRAVYGACPVEKKAETLTVEDLLCNPGRRARPERIVIIVRGPPGAGKTYASKLLKEKEMSNGGTAPRMLCLDDYFMVDKEKTVKDPDTGKEVTKTVLEYEFDAKMEESYIRSFFKSYKRQIDESYFSFIIVDAVFDDKAYLEQFWSYGKHKGFQVYVAEVMADANVCEKRNKHDRTLKDIKKIIEGWQGPPPHYIRLDLRSLLQDAAIEDVEMEDQADESTGDGKNSSKEKEEEEEEEEETQGFTKSKWELDVSEDKLERLDGIRKRRKSESDPKDLGEYLQLTDDYDSRTSEPGKKRVRWADIEERKSQDKMRKIGFVVGRTNWDKMTDDEYANKALNRTKYI